MTQRKLLIGASTLTLALAAVFFVTTNNTGFEAAGKNKKSPKPNNKSGKPTITIDAFTDANSNGIKDAGEVGLAGVKFSVTGPKKYKNEPTTTATGVVVSPNKNGAYIVTALSVPAGYQLPITKVQNTTIKTGKKGTGAVTLSFPIIQGVLGTPPDPIGAPIGADDPGTPVGPAYQYVQLPPNKQKVVGKKKAKIAPTTPAVSGQTLRLDLLTQLDHVKDKKAFQLALPVNESANWVRWDVSPVINGDISAPFGPKGKGKQNRIAGVKSKQPIAENYIISYCLATSADKSTAWQKFGFKIKAKDSAAAAVSYRVRNECANSFSGADTDWTELDISSSLGKKAASFSADINETGKYFQYKVNMVGAGNYIESLSVDGQPLSGTGTGTRPPPVACDAAVESCETPSSGPTDIINTPTGQTNPPGLNGEGTLLIQTKKLLRTSTATNAQSSSSSGGSSSSILLPTPRTSASASADATSVTVTPVADPDATNPLCFGEQNLDEAVNVPLTLEEKSTATGRLKLENQQTNDVGEWEGLNGEQDSFPAGTYSAKFGELDKAEYKLVAFCDPNGNHILKTQSSPATMTATFQIKPDQQTRIIALYAPRDKSYLTIEKFSIPLTTVEGQPIKLINNAFPGQKLQYLFRITNTGGEKATEILLQDVIPSELEVDLDANTDSSVRVQPDPRGGTLVSYPVADLAPGQVVYVKIPVTVKTTVFTDTSGADTGGSILAP